MRCAVRFWSSEFFCIFVFIIFFFALCVLGLSPFNRKSLPSRAASGGRLQEEPRPAPGSISRLVRAIGRRTVQKTDLKTSPKGARGRAPLSLSRKAAAVFRLSDKLESGAA
jgi:hypothetical protein